MTKIFSNKGRATRREFWTTCLSCILIICITGPMIDKIGNTTLRGFSIFGLVFLTCWVLGCVTRKRCHDLGISSWKQFNPRVWFRDSYFPIINSILLHSSMHSFA